MLHDILNTMGCHAKTKEDTMRAVLREKFRAVNAHTRGEKGNSTINLLSFYLGKL